MTPEAPTLPGSKGVSTYSSDTHSVSLTFWLTCQTAGEWLNFYQPLVEVEVNQCYFGGRVKQIYKLLEYYTNFWLA